MGQFSLGPGRTDEGDCFDFGQVRSLLLVYRKQSPRLISDLSEPPHGAARATIRDTPRSSDRAVYLNSA